ncbi:MAG: uracil phosphoribosyltransferase [Bacteroidota bacterium]
MLANNFFRAIADFTTDCLFQPYDALRSIDSWWISNIVSIVLLSIGTVLFFYWLGQLQKFRKTANE